MHRHESRPAGINITIVATPPGPPEAPYGQASGMCLGPPARTVSGIVNVPGRMVPMRLLKIEAIRPAHGRHDMSTTCKNLPSTGRPTGTTPRSIDRGKIGGRMIFDLDRCTA